MIKMTEEERRAAAAESLARRKQALRKKRARKRRRLLILVILGLILALIMTGIIVAMVKSRNAASAGSNSGAGEEAAQTEAADADAGTLSSDSSSSGTSSNEIVIGLKGSEVQMVLEGDPYIENGAFAVDRNSGAIPEKDIKIKGSVDTSKTGDYEITYTAGKGSSKQSVTRTVRVLSEEDFGRAAVNVPVMMYHWVYTADDVPEDLDGNWILDTTLDEQLTYLEDEGFYYPGWKELRAWVDGEISIPAKCAVLTFDDGKEPFLMYGVPLLEKHKIPATSFMICWEDNDGEDKIRKYASPYLDFESHTYAMHQKSDDPDHKGIDAVMTKEEIAADLSKASEILGTNDAIAYPYGDYTDDFIAAVRDQGLLLGFTVEYDRVRQGMDPLTLPRIRVLGDESFQIWKDSVS